MDEITLSRNAIFGDDLSLCPDHPFNKGMMKLVEDLNKMSLKSPTPQATIVVRSIHF